MKPSVFTTRNGNSYLYSPYKKMFLPIDKTLNQAILNNDINSLSYKCLKDNNYLDAFKEDLEGEILPEDIEIAICNIPQVIFEVTSACNLRCEYCCYGDGYNTFKNRLSGTLDFKTAKIVLNFLQEKMLTINNISTQTPFVISFYGGEPLLNINLIKEIVEYSNNLKLPQRIKKYSLTTNATHLAENIDFLKENNFHILVSLDGDRFANQHRRLPNGEESFDIVIKNLYTVKRKYPDYFKRIRYNAVFSNTSDIDEVFKFFKENFDAVPTISMLHEPDKEAIGYDYIKDMVKPIGLPRSKALSDEALFQIPLHKSIVDFLFKLTHNYFHSEFDILAPNQSVHYATATCVPFARRMFVTTNGFLLPCEKICRDIPFGKVINGKVDINYAELSSRHNYIINQAKKQCCQCYLQSCCNKCAYNFKQGQCSSFKNQSQFKKILSDIFTYMELHPEITNTLEENIILK